MNGLLQVSKWIDALTDRLGWVATWAVFVSCIISAANTVVRYAASYSSNAFLEIQWYMLAVCVMFGASQVLRVNEHVRVDVLYGMYPGRTQALVDLAGYLLFFMPSMLIMLYFSWPMAKGMLLSGEMSSNAGGLIRWPAAMTLPIGFALLILQGVSEIIKRIAWLAHRYQGDFHYERPLQ